MTDIAHKAQKVSPVHSTAAGLAAFIGGAAIAGGCHYVATAKRLAEEGIDPRQRVKAFPVAVKALGVSTIVCSTFGACAWFAMKQTGMFKPVAEVASFHDTIAMAQQQRDAVAREFQKKLYPSEINN